MRITTLLLFSLALAAPGPARAADVDCCSRETKDRMAADRIAQRKDDLYDAAFVKDVQTCLVARGLYQGVPKGVDPVDGRVGAFTWAALSACTGAKPAPAAPECGDGTTMVAWVLTDDGIKKLQTEQKQLELEIKQQEPEVSQNTPQPLSDSFLKKLDLIKNITYPSRDLFVNAFDYFTRQTREENPDLKNDLTYRTDIIAGACHVLEAKASPRWVAKSDAPMLIPLSQTTYGFYPGPLKPDPKPEGDKPAESAKAAPPPEPAPIDFSILQRIGWFGVTFDGDGLLNLPPTLQQSDSAVSKQIELARRYRTSVDLVVYKKMSASQWKDLIGGKSQDPLQLAPAMFSERLSASIASQVGAPLTGFLDTVQRSVLPNVLTSAPTAWDGVTLYFEGYPFEDDAAMKYLVDFIRSLRGQLRQNELWATFASRNAHDLNLNVVIPYDSLVSKKSFTISYLAGLVSKANDEPTTYTFGSDQDDIVDRFIVFLPQPTSSNKKTLRLAVEAAFNETLVRKASFLKTESNSAWRDRMEHKIIYVLSTGSWSWKGEYSRPGKQFYDDMGYAKYKGVGFWPVPEYNDDNKPLAADVRDIFHIERQGAFQKYVPALLKHLPAFLVTWADTVGAYRRELWIFVVEPIAALLILYGILAIWLFELRRFFRERTWWFVGPFLLMLGIVVLLCLFDRELSSYASVLFLVFLTVFVAGWVTRRYYLGTVERDLP